MLPRVRLGDRSLGWQPVVVVKGVSGVHEPLFSLKKYGLLMARVRRVWLASQEPRRQLWIGFQSPLQSLVRSLGVGTQAWPCDSERWPLSSSRGLCRGAYSRDARGIFTRLFVAAQL